jgi:hypothetical protein
MKEKFEDHYSDADILKININSETAKWKEVLEFNTNEIDFYKSLLNLKLAEKSESRSEDAEYWGRQLKDIEGDNKFHHQTLVDFERKLEGMKECDDVQCENYYLQDHLILKASLEKHFSNYRTLQASLQEFISKEMKEPFSGLNHQEN